MLSLGACGRSWTWPPTRFVTNTVAAKRGRTAQGSPRFAVVEVGSESPGHEHVVLERRQWQQHCRRDERVGAHQVAQAITAQMIIPGISAPAAKEPSTASMSSHSMVSASPVEPGRTQAHGSALCLSNTW